MVIANFSVWYFGPWSTPFNAFVLIGLDLTLRDVMQERLPRWQLAMTICIGAIITYMLNPTVLTIAIASTIAFFASALVDWLIYTLLRERTWFVRSNVSNAFGAAVDSMLFPTIAFGVLMPHIIALQFASKFFGGALWSIILNRLFKMDAFIARIRRS
jgi:uncharacterized PurR-regulated membrane protein YhhQ (DUF165 family)